MRPEDFDRYAQIWAMPEVVTHILPGPRDRRSAWESFLRNAGHWQMAGFGQWAVIDQQSREMIGQAGFFYASSVIGEDVDPLPNAGWMLVPEAQGKGLGREAVAAAHDWFDRVIPGPLVARVGKTNGPSLALAERLNYAPLREVDDGEGSVILLRRNGPARAA